MKKILLFLALLCTFCFASAQEVKISQFDKNVQMQIFLLDNDFSPGKIDGKSGKYTSLIFNLYKKAHPLESLQSVDKSLEQISPLYTTYTIRVEDKKFVGKVPEKLSAQAL